jgi:hypothetical protein
MERVAKLCFPLTPLDMSMLTMFMVLAEVGNEKTPMIGRSEGIDGDKVLDTTKTLLRMLLCGHGRGTLFLSGSHMCMHVSLVIDDLQRQPQQVGAATFGTSHLVLIFEHQVSIFRVKS